MKKQDFADKVIEIVALIPKGRVCTYGLIANYIGTGGSARTVGYILGHSLQGHKVPAHRVVNAAGLLSGKAAFGGTEMQKRLQQDGVDVINDKVLNFNDILWNPSIELA
ncbi:MAG: MGMT family protein [Bacteroidia bacterium]